MKMSEDVVKQVGFLRKNGGFSITPTYVPELGSFVVTGYFKDTNSYGTTVSFAAIGADLDDAQKACVSGLAKLVHYTNDAKPAASAGKTNVASGDCVVVLTGLKDPQWQKAKDLVKEAGFRFDKETKNWAGGDASRLPDWLQKRVKGGSGATSSSSSYSKPAPKPEPVEEEDTSVEEEDFPF